MKDGDQLNLCKKTHWFALLPFLWFVNTLSHFSKRHSILWAAKKKIDLHLYDLYVYIYVYHGADRSTCSLDYRVFFIIIKCHELSYQAGIWNYYLCSALLLFKSKNVLLNYFFPLSTVCQHELQCFIKQWKVNGKNLWHEVYSVSKWLRYDE